MPDPINQTLNDLSKLTLIASDAAYFTLANPVPPGSSLAPLDDTSYGPTVPGYDFSAAEGFQEVTQFSDPATGFKFIAYKNVATNEVIVSFGGTDGPNPTDWTNNTNLGWNQWDANRDTVLQFLQGLGPGVKVDFTGQSLGAALAQYATYEYVKDQIAQAAQNGTTFDKSTVTLTTFNGLGGLKALEDHGGYDSSVLDGLGAVAHYSITNDLVSELGGGHIGNETILPDGTRVEQTYRLDFRSETINPSTGEPYDLGPVDAHRIETGFYANLSPGVEFMDAEAQPISYLSINSLQDAAALFGNLLNDKDFGTVESNFRLMAAVMGGLTFSDPADVNTLVQAVLKGQHDSGSMSDGW